MRYQYSDETKDPLTNSATELLPMCTEYIEGSFWVPETETRALNKSVSVFPTSFHFWDLEAAFNTFNVHGQCLNGIEARWMNQECVLSQFAWLSQGRQKSFIGPCAYYVLYW